mmetsp:Transcript_14617/g.47610  ORF Transcript_14617/g.47610 Transcript_14617/m.47610 type:complete len:258 (-) Transcript_14617:686-1459(-)
MKSRLLGPFDGGEAGAAEFLELLEGDGEVPEEGAEVLGVDLGVFAELLVVAEEEVGGKHHELLRGIFVLGRPVPVPELPGDVQEEGVVGVRQEDRRRRPEAVVAGVERIAPAEGVSTGEGDDVLVGEAHAVEDVVAEVLRRLLRRTLVGVGEAAVGGDGIDGLVDAAVRPRHRGPAGLLDGRHARQRVQVPVAQCVAVLLLDRVQPLHRLVEARIRGVALLLLEAHRPTVAPAPKSNKVGSVLPGKKKGVASFLPSR